MSDVKDWDDEKKMVMAKAIIQMISDENKLFFRVRGQDGELYYGQFNSGIEDTYLGDTDNGKLLVLGVHELIGPAKHGDEFDDNIIPFPKS